MKNLIGRKAASLQGVNALQHTIICQGGLDTETPSWSAKSGSLARSLNYEIALATKRAPGGYCDIKGYERFDGRIAPSDAAYSVVPITTVDTIAVGDTITQDTSGATGVVLVVEDDRLVLTKLTGTFNDSDDYRVGGNVVATPSDTPSAGSAETPALNALWRCMAAAEYRPDITRVPGEDAVLGIFMLQDEWYALRNAVGGASAVLHRATASGWSAVSLGFHLPFTSGGTYVVAEGNTITGATSSATAVITRVVVTSGSWAAGTAAGYFVMASKTGNFAAENLNVGGNLNVATIAANAVANVFQPGGYLKTVRTTFGGSYQTPRIYGADGVSYAFEFDGTVYVPIFTGMSPDTPHDVFEHKNHLFLAFGSGVQHSGIGEPFLWTLLTGADALALDGRQTGFTSLPGSEATAALAIYTETRLHVLYGTDSTNWNLVPFREAIGAYAGSVQELAQPLFLSGLGLTSLAAAQSYGNFAHSALSDAIHGELSFKRGAVAASMVVRDKSQYRLFFTDGSGYYVTMRGDKVDGFMPVLFPDVVHLAYQAIESDGTERLFFGDSDGWVYELDKGTSFDGDEIEGYLDLHFDDLRRGGLHKGFLSAHAEVAGNGYAEVGLLHAIDYGRTSVTQSVGATYAVSLSAPLYDSGLTYDSGLNYDGVPLTPIRFSLGGEGENISIRVRRQSDCTEPLCFSGFRIRYTIRRQVR